MRPGLAIAEDELQESFARSGGPGGQNVNKVASKVVLRFSVASSPSLTDEQRQRLLQSLRASLTKAGELVIHASGERDQASNRREARERLAEALRAGLTTRARRRVTRPTRASKERRLARKRRHSDLKRQRGETSE